ncbi:hypothetical protein VTL71DRAFT_2986 [Oculimacula yallundae]|uniref:Guanine deaminase n=1 Tax=Oculimacula yallundae TaxID=86028 RepID=A0ABR4C5V6_9HELO
MNTPVFFHGAIIHSLEPNKLEILPNAALLINTEGRIEAFSKDYTSSPLAIPPAAEILEMPPGNFLIPGFIDTHNHAAQWSMRGLGQGLHILDWLSQVTFPYEARFSDAKYARRIYESCVEGFLQQGITTASYYCSKHAEASQILAEICVQKGQRAFVGKCNMDRSAPDFIRDESAATSLAETRECVEHIRGLGSALVKPVLTPRFAICCSPDLLEGLGAMMKDDEQLAMQTHFNEAEQEIRATRELFPQFQNEADLYESFGLLGNRSILAHCTIMSEYEMERLKSLECGIAHCPISNMTVGGGFMAAPIREFLRRGIKVGLGTDSGGGFASGMLDNMRQAMIASNAREVMSAGKDNALSMEEVFYLATLGGAKVMCLEEEIGNFEVGKQFDACWINMRSSSIATMYEEGDEVGKSFEKFVMTGDDRNIMSVYVRGKRVAGYEKQDKRE